MTSSISLLDCRILRELDKNSRSSMRSIAERLKEPTESVRYRFRRLKTSGVISNFSAHIDGQLLGLQYHHIAIELKPANQTEREGFASAVKKIPGLCWVALIEGEFDCLLKLRTQSLEDLKKALNSLLDQHAPHIARIETSAQVYFTHLSRGYLTNRAHPRIELNPMNTSTFTTDIDDTDRKILLQLGQNALCSHKEISQFTSVTDDAVRLRIAKLEQQKIITRYSYLLDPKKSEISLHFIAIRSKPQTLEQHEKFLDALTLQKGIVQVTQTIGFWDYLLYLEQFDSGNPKDTLRNLDRSCADFIENCWYLPLGSMTQLVSF